MIAASEDELWQTVDELRLLKQSTCPVSGVGSPFVAPPSPAMQMTPASERQLLSEFLTYWEDFVIGQDDGTVGRPGKTVCPFSPTAGRLGTLLCKVVRHEGLASLDEGAWSELEAFFVEEALPRMKDPRFWKERIGSLETDGDKRGWKAKGEAIPGAGGPDAGAGCALSPEHQKFQVMVFLFPELALSEAAAARLTQLRLKLKPTFVENDLMFIPFHMHNRDRPSEGARRTKSAPGRSLVPFFQIRQITHMDLPYVKPDAYTAAQGFSEEQMREMQEAWQRKYDAHRAERQAAEARAAAARGARRPMAALLGACGGRPALLAGLWLATAGALLAGALARMALSGGPRKQKLA